MYRCRSYRVMVFLYTMIFMLFVCSYDYSAIGLGETEDVSYSISQQASNYISEEPIAPDPEPIEEDPPVQYFDVPLDESLQDHIFELCEARGIDPAVIISVIGKESHYNASALGDHGNSLGLMQIQPRWHRARMEKLGCNDLLDPYQNVTVGIDLLGDLLQSGGSIEWALMAYNGGSSYANRKAAQGEISDYAKTVLNMTKECATYDKL